MTQNAFTPFSLSVDSEQECAALMTLIDAGNRHLGAAGAGATVAWLQKIGAARQNGRSAEHQAPTQRVGSRRKQR